MVLVFCTRRFWTSNRYIFEKSSLLLEKLNCAKQTRSDHNSATTLKTDTQRNYSDRKICVKQPPCLRSELLCNVVEPVQDGLNKVTIVGAGMVGLACVNAILFQKISSHVALVDAFPKKLRGEGLDYTHGLSFLGQPQLEYDTDFCVSSNSKVVIVTIGARQLSQESSPELMARNTEIIKSIILPLVDYSPKAVFIIVTSPVDIMSWLTWKISGLPVNRVIGTGTHLDSARFRHLISNRLGIAAKSIHAYIVGEHGETQVPLWSHLNVAGIPFRDILPNIGMTTDEEKWYELAEETVQAEATVQCLKGQSNVAIGLAVADIVKAILRNTQSIKCVSTLVQGHYDVCQEMFLSLPCSIGERGISNVVRVRMTEHERKLFQNSATHVFNMQKNLKI